MTVALAKPETTSLSSLTEREILNRLEVALVSLEAAHTLIEAKNIRAGLHAMEKWARVRNFSRETQVKANQVVLRADYQFGLWLKDQEKSKGGDASLYACSKTEQASKAPTYREQGIDRKDAMRCQQLAALTEEQVEATLSKAADEGKRLTVSRAVKLATKETRPETKAAPSLPEGVFSLIYADPPWQTDFERGDTRDVEKHYPTMGLDAIKRLAVPAMSAADCILFLWATSPMLPKALEVLQAWGFTYKTSSVWCKSGMGMGYYFRQDHELLLIGTRGRPGTPEPANRPSSVVLADKGRHSEKPAAFYDLIERMYPQAKRVELFARKRRQGWSVWGTEVNEEK